MTDIIEVPEGFEDLASAILKCGICVVAIGLEPEPEEFFVSFDNADDCERFADMIVACAEQEILDKLFGNSQCVTGSFSVEITNDDDDYRTFTVMELCLPTNMKDNLTTIFQNASKLIDAEVSYCDANSRLSKGTIENGIPKSEWDGHIFSHVPGVETLEPGELVKLTFHASAPSHITERLWVMVTAVDDDDVIGTIDNHPASLTNLNRGDTIHFKKHQISRVAPAKKLAEIRNAALN